MQTISSHTFKYTLRDIHKHTENRKFCFVIGAGASSKSGIPTGKQLAENWFKEINERCSDTEIKEWMNDIKIDTKDLAAHYGSIYRKRFESDKTSGYEFLVQAMRSAKPTFGHIVLAQILSKASGNCVITTNFDSLIETAIYQFTDKTPLVCGHESLSGYARPSEIHPLIIKIHRDLLLAPKSDPDEIKEIDKGWKEPLDNIFSSHIPVVIGYGGNDGSLMSYFEQMNKPSNFFWCGLTKTPASSRVENLIKQMNGNFVEIDGFDEILHELLWVFDEIKPIEEEMGKITKERIKAVDKQLDEIKAEPERTTAEDSTTEKELSAFEYSALAENEPDYEKRKAIYLKALDNFPTTAWLWNHFTHFLYFVKKETSGLEDYYLNALAVAPEDANINGSYAIFLKNNKKDYEKAEKYYLKAVTIDPEHAGNNRNYAVFLKDVKRDYEKAEKYYLKALAIDAENVINNGNYANFLTDFKKDHEKAEKYYLKALAIDPEHASTNSNYALYLSNIKKDYEKAGKYYLKALAIDPEHAYINGNYAGFLFAMERKSEAIQYLEKAFRLNRGENNGLLAELWFYKYAHCLESLGEEERTLENVLKEGILATGSDLSINVNVAIENGHPHPEKLKELAEKITTSKD